MHIINSSAEDTVQVHEVHVEMDEATAAPVALEVILVRKINGQQVTEPSFTMTAGELAAWLDATPTPGLSRGDDLANSLLQWVLDTGRATGTIVAG